MNTNDAIAEFLEQTSGKYPLLVKRSTIDGFRSQGDEALQHVQKQQPVVWVLNPASRVIDVAALRWSLPGGRCPIVFIVNPDAAQSVVSTAAEFAIRQRTLVLLIVEESELSGDSSEFDELASETLPAPPDEAPTGEAPIIESPELDQFQLDTITPEDGRAEWLVISYGSAIKPASEAVEQVRSDGQRVNHLILNTLYPLREGVLMRAAMGISHIVVAEPNAGQYYLDIKREAPGIAVMPAGSPDGLVTVDHVLERLQKTPRCC